MALQTKDLTPEGRFLPRCAMQPGFNHKQSLVRHGPCCACAITLTCLLTCNAASPSGEVQPALGTPFPWGEWCLQGFFVLEISMDAGMAMVLCGCIVTGVTSGLRISRFIGLR